MALRRFYIPPESIQEGVAVLPAGQAHHLRDVLRIRAGEAVEIFDGVGKGYAGEVAFRGPDVLVCGLQILPAVSSPVRLVLVAALIKSAKFEWILQKATELGVDAILPLNTELSDIRIPDAKIRDRADRWDRIVKESSKQCRRFASPSVLLPMDFEDFLRADEYSPYTRFLFYEKSRDPWQPEGGTLSGSIALCIGPEGGWTEREIECAQQAGCRILSLGPWTLRAETAAIAAVAILQHQIYLPGR